MVARRLILGCQLVALVAIGGLITAPAPAFAGRDGGSAAHGPERDDAVAALRLMLSARPDGRLVRAPEAQPPQAFSRPVGLLPELPAPPRPHALGAVSATWAARAPIARAAVPKTSRGPPGT